MNERERSEYDFIGGSRTLTWLAMAGLALATAPIALVVGLYRHVTCEHQWVYRERGGEVCMMCERRV